MVIRRLTSILGALALSGWLAACSGGTTTGTDPGPTPPGDDTPPVDDTPPGPEEDTTPPVTTASPGGGIFGEAMTVTLACDDATGSGCAATYFTTDGSLPTASSTLYTAPHTISANTTLRFFSVDEAGNAETPRQEIYYIGTAPSVVSAWPAPDSVDVAASGEQIVITFSEAMNESTLASALHMTPPTPGSVDYDASTHTLTYTPSEPLAYAQSYTISVTTSAQSAAGIPFASAYAWSFTVEASPTVRLDEGNHAIHREAQVLFNDAGDGMAVWVEQTYLGHSGAHIVVAGYDGSSGTWFEPQYLIDRVGVDTDILLVTNGASWALAQRRSHSTVLRVVERVGDAWEVTASRSLSQRVEVLASNGAGYLAAWVYLSRLLVSRYDDGSWTTATQVADNYVSNLSLAGGGGRYVLAWEHRETSLSSAPRSIYVMVHHEGAWSDSEEIDIGENSATWPVVQARADGGGFAVAWQQLPDGGDHQHVIVRHYDPVAEEWATATLFGHDTLPASAPRLASAENDYVLAWALGSESSMTLHASRWKDGDWGSSVRLSDARSIAHHQLIASSSGYAAVWTDTAEPSETVGRLVASTLANSWSPPAVLEAQGVRTDAIAVAGLGAQRFAVTASVSAAGGWEAKGYSYDEGWSGHTLAGDDEPPLALRVASASADFVAAWSFGPEVVARAFAAEPTKLGASSSAVSSIEAVAGDAGTLLTAWTQLDGRAHVLKARLFNGHEWLPSVTLSSEPAMLWHSFAPQLLAAADRFAIAYDTSAGSVWRVFAEGEWGEPLAMDSASHVRFAAYDGNFYALSVHLDEVPCEDDCVIIASESSPQCELWARQYGDGAWEAPEVLASFEPGDGIGTMEVDEKGSACGIRALETASGPAGLAVMWDNGGSLVEATILQMTWSPVATVPITPGGLHLKAGASGFAVTSGGGEDSDEERVEASFYHQGAWSEPHILASELAWLVDVLEVPGGFLLLWMSEDGTEEQQEAWSAVWRDGVLSEPTQLADFEIVAAAAAGESALVALYDWEIGEVLFKLWDGEEWQEGSAFDVMTSFNSAALVPRGDAYRLFVLDGGPPQSQLYASDLYADGWSSPRLLSSEATQVANHLMRLLSRGTGPTAAVWIEHQQNFYYSYYGSSLWGQAAF